MSARTGSLVRAGAFFALLISLVLPPHPGVAAHTLGRPLDHPQPFTWMQFGPTVPCGVACGYWLGFDACSKPFPSVSYTDKVVLTPAGADVFELQIFPVIDSDVVLCHLDGERMFWGHDLMGYPPCGRVAGRPIPIDEVGCAELWRIGVRDLEGLIMRVFNWDDVPRIWGRYRFIDLDAP